MGPEELLEIKMPILSDKQIINISFKHIENKEDGNDVTIDVNAFLEDGSMKVKLKVGGKLMVISLQALKEIIEYISIAIPKMSMSNGNIALDDNHPAEKAAISNQSEISGSGKLEAIIFGGSQAGANGEFSNPFASKSYASPTMIASSASAISRMPDNQVSSWSGLVAGNKDVPGSPMKETRSSFKRNSLNLRKDESVDEEGRMVIDLNDGEEKED